MKQIYALALLATIILSSCQTNREIPQALNCSCQANTVYMVIEVFDGDTFTSVAKQFNTTPEAILIANSGCGYTRNTELDDGMLLKIPVQQSLKIYDTPSSTELVPVEVYEGDTLESISQDFSSTVELILQANPKIKSNKDLKEGMLLKIPLADIIEDNTPLRVEKVTIGSSTYDCVPIEVYEGDTLENIAQDFSSTVKIILKFNPKIKSNKDLKEGIFLKIPFNNQETDEVSSSSMLSINGSKYDLVPVEVYEGDTLESMAKDFTSTVELILKANSKIKSNEDLKEGMILQIPLKNNDKVESSKQQLIIE